MVGDDVLRRIAQVTRASVRETDIVGRYGGDEFLVMLPHANARDAFAAAERIRKGVEKLTVTSKPGRPVPVTVSVGMIAAVPHEADVLRFLEIADQALHRSKGLGKNCTILCDVPATADRATTEGEDAMTTAKLEKPLTKNSAVLKWVEECTALLKPARVQWVEGTDTEKKEMIREALQTGDLEELNQDSFARLLFAPFRPQRCGADRTPDLYLHPHERRGRPQQQLDGPRRRLRETARVYDGAMNDRTCM
jgi:predicted signal transduction protein with EAL and GGDEF domain